MKRLLRYWGKTRESLEASSPEWHPLACHCLDVAAVAQVWLKASPCLRRECTALCDDMEANAEQINAWLLFFVALHDLGKFDLRFQFKVLNLVQELFPEAASSKIPSRGFDHGQAGYAWSVFELADWLNHDDTDAWTAWTAWSRWLQAVMSHHGDFIESSSIDDDYADEALVAADRHARLQWVRFLEGLFLRPVGLSLADQPPTLPDTMRTFDWLAGFCATCDWLASNEVVSPYLNLSATSPIETVEPINAALAWPVLAADELLDDRPSQAAATDFLTDYFSRRVVEIERSHWLSRFGLLAETRPYAGCVALLAEDEAPRGVQVLVDDLPTEPSLLIIEAPTGSGKTEAALAYAWRLLAGDRADSLVFALPTQATANAMFDRSRQFARHAFQSGANAVLAHGKRDQNEAFQQLRHTADSGGYETAGVQCAAWLAQSRKRAFLGQVGVCTVDQTLLSVLPVRHRFVRGFALARSVLIVDEVHAYDAYMHELLVEVLQQQRQAGASAILLSATLPPSVRRQLLAAWQVGENDDSASPAPYPAVWVASDATPSGTVEPRQVPADQQPAPRSVGIERLAAAGLFPDTNIMARIVAAAQSGARVAVVMNLVDDVQRLAAALTETAQVPVDVFHARYRFVDRQAREQQVLQHYGRGAPRVGGRILVASQVVEQSLDLDFDWLVTQLCPVDLLFQRLGRLHRHKQNRPEGFQTPHCLVLCPDGSDYGLHKLIYGRARVLWRTEQMLIRHDRIEFPAAYRQWLDAVYDPAIWDDEPDTVYADYLSWQATQRNAAVRAKVLSQINVKAYRDSDVIAQSLTRDGEMSWSVLPLLADGRGLEGDELTILSAGEAAEWRDLRTVPVPATWEKLLSGLDRDDQGRYCLTVANAGNDVWQGSCNGVSYRYSSWLGLQKGGT